MFVCVCISAAGSQAAPQAEPVCLERTILTRAACLPTETACLQRLLHPMVTPDTLAVHPIRRLQVCVLSPACLTSSPHHILLSVIQSSNEYSP